VSSWWPVSSWLFVLLAGALGVVGAVWLRRGAHRRPDDEVQRRISPWAVPVVAVLLSAGAVPFLRGQPTVVLLTCTVALVWGTVLALVDLELLRLPDLLVLPAYGVAAVLLSVCSLVTGDLGALLRAAACAGLAVLVYLAAAWFSPRSEGLGLGDVKLAGVLAALLGWFGWYEAVLGLLTGFVLAAAASLVLIALRRLRLSSAIPFGPAMLLGAYLWCLLAPTA